MRAWVWPAPLWAALLCGIVLGAMPGGTALAAPPAQDPGTIHVVQAGETLFRIAQRYDTTVAEIKRYLAARDVEVRL